MFEKEAEEYREKGKSDGYYLVSQEMEQEGLDYIIDEAFKDGAEFGYNKCKEEINQKGLALQSAMTGELHNARDIILMLYNAIRDYLMLPSEDTHRRLSIAIEDKRIEYFIERVK